MHKRILFLGLVNIILLGLVWITLVPLWHFPDEQAHFAQIAYIAETGKNPDWRDEKNLTDEINISEILLGTSRDLIGNNKFTFHPEYKIEYTNSLEGKYEASISALAKSSSRNTFVKKEATKYPVLYYLIGAVIYKIFYYQDLIIRVYLVRLWSLILFVSTVVISYKLGMVLFPGNKKIQITFPMLVAFQPMMVFANLGVTSDSLGNLIFTLFLYINALMISNKISLNKAFISFLVMAVACISKPQFWITIPIFFSLLVYLFLRDVKIRFKKFIIPFFVLLILFILSIMYLLRIGIFSLLFQIQNRFDLQSLFKYTFEYTLSHTYREVLPWYWGIFDWLGVTYPRSVHRIINWSILISLIGLIKFIILKFRLEKLKKKDYQTGLFLTLTGLLFFIGISLYDWYIWYISNYSLGVQGRYFFPTITVHMMILLIGWREMKLEKIAGVSIILLNFFALYTITKTYYDTSSFSQFIIQVSQYKPFFVKGWGFLILLFIFLISQTIFLIKYIRYPHEKTS